MLDFWVDHFLLPKSSMLGHFYLFNNMCHCVKIVGTLLQLTGLQIWSKTKIKFLSRPWSATRRVRGAKRQRRGPRRGASRRRPQFTSGRLLLDPEAGDRHSARDPFPQHPPALTPDRSQRTDQRPDLGHGRATRAQRDASGEQGRRPPTPPCTEPTQKLAQTQIGRWWT